MNEPSPIEQGLRHHDAGRLDQAEACYREALAADSSDAEALKLLAVLAAERGQTGDALAYADAATKAKPDVAAYHHLLGVLKARVDDFLGAHQAFRTAAAKQSQVSAQLLCDLAACDERLERWSDAQTRYASALEREPESLMALYGAARAAAVLGQHAASKAFLERVLALKPDDPVAGAQLRKITESRGP